MDNLIFLYLKTNEEEKRNKQFVYKRLLERRLLNIYSGNGLLIIRKRVILFRNKELYHFVFLA